MLTHIICGESSGAKSISDTQIEYMGAKFSVDIAQRVEPILSQFESRRPRVIISVGEHSYENAVTALTALGKRLQCGFGLQAIEIGQYYTDLISRDFKYVKLVQNKFQNLCQEDVTLGTLEKSLKELENRITTKMMKFSDMPSHLFVVKARCGESECPETHGEIAILALSKKHVDWTQDIFSCLQK